MAGTMYHYTTAHHGRPVTTGLPNVHLYDILLASFSIFEEHEMCTIITVWGGILHSRVYSSVDFYRIWPVSKLKIIDRI